MNRVWDRTICEMREMPEDMNNFLEEIKLVCKKYNLSISHEDYNGVFLIERYNEKNIEWLFGASKNYEDDINELWCEEYQDYYGNHHPEYGGTLTDLYKLPIGTKFYVANGCWTGEILSDNHILVHAPKDDVVVKLTDKSHSLYLK